MACARLGDKEEATRHRERFAALKEAGMQADRDRNKAYDDLSARRQAVVKRHVLAGAIQLQFDHLRMAEAHWLRAGAIEPEDIPTREALGALFEKQGRPGAALQVLGELVQIEPENSEHLLRKGRVLLDLESWAEAKQAFERVVELSPDSVEGHGRLAQIYLRSGSDLEAAKLHAEETVRLAPSTASLSLLAAVRAQLGDHQGARTALKEALELEPNNAEIRQAYEQLQED